MSAWSDGFLRLADAWRDQALSAAPSFTLFAAALLVVDRLLLRHAWPSLRLGLHVVVLLKWLVPVGLTAPWSVSWPTAAAAPVVEGAARSPGFLVPLLFSLWVLGVVVLVARAWRTIRRERRALLRDALVDPVTLARVEEVRARVTARLPGGSCPRLVVSATATSAAIVGGGSSLIVLPSRLLDPAASAAADHALLHELVHHRRRDLWVAAGCTAVALLAWFHPLAWLLVRRTELLRELACDDEVVRRLRGEAPDYRRTLLVQARELLARRQPVGALAFLSAGSSLRARLEWLGRARSFRPVRERWSMALAALVLAAFAWPAAGELGSSPRSRLPSDPALLAAARATLAAATSPDPPPGCLRRRYALAYLASR